MTRWRLDRGGDRQANAALYVIVITRMSADKRTRAYVERLVLPTIVEPLRSEWDAVRTAALVHAKAGRLDAARDIARQVLNGATPAL